jgi:hypothetical protein
MNPSKYPTLDKLLDEYRQKFGGAGLPQEFQEFVLDEARKLTQELQRLKPSELDDYTIKRYEDTEAVLARHLTSPEIQSLLIFWHEEAMNHLEQTKRYSKGTDLKLLSEASKSRNDS